MELLQCHEGRVVHTYRETMKKKVIKTNYGCQKRSGGLLCRVTSGVPEIKKNDKKKSDSSNVAVIPFGKKKVPEVDLSPCTSATECKQ